MTAIPEKFKDTDRAAALDKALVARRAYARAKSDLAAGRITFSEALDDPELSRMRLEPLLRAVPGVGSAIAEKLMRDCGIAKTKRVGGLGTRQRAALAPAAEAFAVSSDR